MARILGIFFLIVLAINTTDAQIVNIGPKAGINIASQGGDLEETNSKFGLRGGAFIDIKLGERWFIQPQVHYSSQGSEIENSQSLLLGALNVSFEVDNSVDYLTLPVLAKYHIYESEAFKFYGKAGPYFGFLINSKTDYKVSATVSNFAQSGTGTSSQSFDTSSSFSDRFKKADFGLTFGFGASFKAGKGAITLDVTYNLGLINIADDNYILPSTEFENFNRLLTTGSGGNAGIWSAGSLDSYEPSYDATIRNSALSIMVGYAFKLN